MAWGGQWGHPAAAEQGAAAGRAVPAGCRCLCWAPGTEAHEVAVGRKEAPRAQAPLCGEPLRSTPSPSLPFPTPLAAGSSAALHGACSTAGGQPAPAAAVSMHARLCCSPTASACHPAGAGICPAVATSQPLGPALRSRRRGLKRPEAVVPIAQAAHQAAPQRNRIAPGATHRRPTHPPERAWRCLPSDRQARSPPPDAPINRGVMQGAFCRPGGPERTTEQPVSAGVAAAGRRRGPSTAPKDPG